MPVKTMECPKCKHSYNLPSREAQYGFKRCPKCGHRKNDNKNQLIKNFKSSELAREPIAKAI
jgi:Zn ribbon nucleic-acid-binding protein